MKRTFLAACALILLPSILQAQQPVPNPNYVMFTIGNKAKYGTPNVFPKTITLPQYFHFTYSKDYTSPAGGTVTLDFYHSNLVTDVAQLVSDSGLMQNLNSVTRVTGFTFALIVSGSEYGVNGRLFRFDYEDTDDLVFGAGINAGYGAWSLQRSLDIDFDPERRTEYSANLWDPIPEREDEMLVFFTFQPDGQVRIDQFDLDRTSWQAGLIDGGWPIVREGKSYYRAPFDRLILGDFNSTPSSLAGFFWWTKPLTTDQMVAYVLGYNRELKYEASSSRGEHSLPSNSGYWLPAKKGEQPDPFCSYCISRQSPAH